MKTRNPPEVALFGVLAMSTARSALGELPPSLLQSPILGQLAAIGICLGSIAAIVGILWRNRDDGLIIEQFANAMVGFGCLFYAVALWLSTDSFTDTAIILGITVGISATCVARYFQIQRYIHDRKIAARTAA